MKNSEKDEVMKRFKNRELDILVSTTVIEVGVDVPNATIMVINNSERFGLSSITSTEGKSRKRRISIILFSSFKDRECNF